MTIFQAVNSKVSFPELEERILRFWKELDMLRRVDEARKDSPIFVLYEGPPTANGSPGIHHVLSRVFKDVIPRYKTMKGFRPLRKAGWDTHGLPVELEIEKKLGISTKREIENIVSGDPEASIRRFNELCRASVMEYVDEWEKLTDRIAFWVDTSNAYVTFKNEYIETGWWMLKQLWDRGLLYQGYKVTPHCPRCVTSLSSHEVALGYKEDTPDPSVYVRFRLADDQGMPPPKAPPPQAVASHIDALRKFGYDSNSCQWQGTRPAFLAWTTTPWTLTANVALAVAPYEDYVLVEASDGTERLILAKARFKAVLGDGWRVVASARGDELLRARYQPLYSTAPAGYVHSVATADYVSMEDGTGIVHTAPAYGAEDQELGRAYQLPTVHTVDLQGRLNAELPVPGAGKFVKDADKDILRDLGQRGLLWAQGTIRHTYPFCWRCDSPLLYYAKTSWYIRTTACKEDLLAGNEKINWYPDHIKNGRFGEWLRNNVDWAISRERYWGTPLPIWRCESNPEHQDCFGSVAELRVRALPESRPLLEGDGLDLHRPYVDHVVVVCKEPGCRGTMRRISDVLDCWFDSGAMPFAQDHVMSEADLANLRAQSLFPADYICEAVDQTRGWFYTLHALSTLIAGEPCYRNVICLGLILDEKGDKMSKSRGNVVRPWDVLNAQGADALRWYLFTAAPPGNARRFSGPLVEEALRGVLLTLWNVYSFFVTYANIDEFDPRTSQGVRPTSELDGWILSELNTLVADVSRLLEEYNPTDAGRRIQDFVEVLSNWYVRRSRRRFWKSEDDEDKRCAYVTLYTCLVSLCKLMAPFTPFVAEEMYQNLVRKVDSAAPESVHLATYPAADPSLVDQELAAATRLVMRVASMGRNARSKAGMKVRQPLSQVLVKGRTPQEEQLLLKLSHQVLDELNVKELASLRDEREVVEFQIQPNLPLLGPKYGARLSALKQALQRADPLEVAAAVREEREVSVGDFTLLPTELLVSAKEKPGFAVAMEGGYTVAVNTMVTPELADEGLARELVHRLQTMRRSAGFEIADRIVIYYAGDKRLRRVINSFALYIGQETLAEKLVEGEAPQDAYTEALKVDSIEASLAVKRA